MRIERIGCRACTRGYVAVLTRCVAFSLLNLLVSQRRPRCFTLKSLKSDLQPWIERLRSGDARALARAISSVENRRPESAELLKALFPHSGRARILGITGSPGAGKSTLVDQLAKHYRRAGKTLGIIAVDPTSPYTGGAILGDRIRMQDHHADPGIYIRSLATRGSPCCG